MRLNLKSFFVTISSEAEMFTIISAPLSARTVPGDTGTHISSHSSIPTAAPLPAQKSILPNGTSCPQRVTVSHGVSSPDTKWRFS